MILIVLYDSEAFDRTARKTGPVIAKLVDSSKDPDTFKRPLRNLVNSGLLESAGGQQGGYWLSNIGNGIATKLKTSLER